MMKRFQHKWIGIFLACTVTISLAFGEAGGAVSNLIHARSAILVDASDGRVLFEQNADVPIAPASITKVLALYLAFEAVQAGRVHLTDMVYISRAAANAQPVRMGLKAGDRVPLGELIRGMAIVSGNDAAIAVAEYLGGSVHNFVTLMNIKARRLGMLHSHFANPNGLPAKGQVTTARDVARLSMAYLQRFPEALEIHSMQQYTYNNITRRNANKLLGVCPGVDGLKTGFVNASGYNLSATAVRRERRLIAVVLGASTPRLRTLETTRLLEYGFGGAPLTSVPVELVKYKPHEPRVKVTTKARSSRPSKARLNKSRTAAARKQQPAKLSSSKYKCKPKQTVGKDKKSTAANNGSKTKLEKKSASRKTEGVKKHTQGKIKGKSSVPQSRT